MTGERRIDISARDPDGELLAGTDFTFELAGAPFGGVDSSDGRADISLPSDGAEPLRVSASYAGETRSALIGPSQQSFTFTFKRKAKMPEQRASRTGLILAALVVLALLAIGSLYLFRPVVPASEAERAAAEIANNCAGGHKVQNESEVKAGLSNYLSTASGKTNVNSSDVGTVTAHITSNDTGLKFYQAYTQCLNKGTQNWLALKGVKVDADGHDGAPAGAERVTNASVSQGSSGLTAPGGLRGWSYYEEANGKPTDDGVLMPPGADTLLPYAKVTSGTMLKSLRGFKVRKVPGVSGEVLRNVGAGECVRVLGSPAHPITVSKATSGGYLNVALVDCG